MPVRDLEELGAALVFLRRFRRASQEGLAAAAGVPPSSLCEYENGKKEPSERSLGRVLAALHVPRLLFDVLLAGLHAFRQVLAAFDALRGGEPSREADAAAAAGRAAEGFTRAALALAGAAPAPAVPTAEERLAAPGLRAELQPFSHQERLGLVEVGDRYRSWALAELLCAESGEAAADKPRPAVELAELAVRIARFVPGDERWRRHVQGSCEPFLGNALRVSGDLGAAEEAFGRSLATWPLGESDEHGLLDATRRLDLLASLRREQRRIPEALDLLDQALALCPRDSVARILVMKAKTLEEIGEHETALSTLETALPLIDPSDERLLFAARFNVAVNLGYLERHAEADAMLPGVRELAERLDKALHKVRLRWLEARIAAGIGRTEEAIAAFRAVRDEFVARKIAYDAALATLELAVFLAAQGRTAEVKELAAETAPIFKAQCVERERLGALTLFRQAADEERLTAALARRLVREFKRAAASS